VLRARTLALACLAEAEPEPPAPWRVGSSGQGARRARRRCRGQEDGGV